VILRAAIFPRFSRFAASSQFWPCFEIAAFFVKYTAFFAVARNFPKIRLKMGYFYRYFSAVDKHGKCIIMQDKARAVKQ